MKKLKPFNESNRTRKVNESRGNTFYLQQADMMEDEAYPDLESWYEDFQPTVSIDDLRFTWDATKNGTIQHMSGEQDDIPSSWFKRYTSLASFEGTPVVVTSDTSFVLNTYD